MLSIKKEGSRRKPSNIITARTASGLPGEVSMMMDMHIEFHIVPRK